MHCLRPHRASPDQMLLKSLKLEKRNIRQVPQRPLCLRPETLKTAGEPAAKMLEDPQRCSACKDSSVFLHEHSVGAWTKRFRTGEFLCGPYDRAAVSTAGRGDWTSFPAKMLENALPKNFAARPSARILLNFHLPAAALLKRLFAKNASMTAPSFRRLQVRRIEGVFLNACSHLPSHKVTGRSSFKTMRVRRSQSARPPTSACAA